MAGRTQAPKKPDRTPVTEAWLREAFDRLRAEIVQFARTFTAFLLHPGRSARSWHSGEVEFMNPLAFGATAAGIYWAVANALGLFWPVPGNESTDTLATELASAVGPYLHYGLLGAAIHAVLRFFGSRRRLLGSIGIALFAGGSIGTLGALITSGVARWFAYERGTSTLELRSNDIAPVLIFLAATVFYALLCVYMARALQALHYTAGWKVLLAAGFAVLITAVLFGNILPDANYGWHPYIRIEPHGPEQGVSFGFEG
jgi:hypothetical protein